MTTDLGPDLWPRIEPLLGRVEKPARYIGMERGSVTPEHRPDKVSWLLVYPDTYEIGLPNQGLQILYEILNERDDAAAERADAPWVDLEAELRGERCPSVLGRDQPPRSRVRRPRVQPLRRARLHERLELHRPRRRPRPCRGPPCAPSVRHRRRALRVQPGAVGRLRRRLRASATAKRSSARSTTVLAAWKRGRRHSSEGVLRELATVPGVYVPSLYDVEYDGPRSSRSDPGIARRARRRSRSGPSPTSPSGRIRSATWSRSSRSCTTGSTSRCSAGARAGAASARPG